MHDRYNRGVRASALNTLALEENRRFVQSATASQMQDLHGWRLGNAEDVAMSTTLWKALKPSANLFRNLPADPVEAMRQAYEWHVEYRHAEDAYYGIPTSDDSVIGWNDFVHWWINSEEATRTSVCTQWSLGFETVCRIFNNQGERLSRHKGKAA